MQESKPLREMIEERPLTSLGGALMVGFALGSGLALPVLAGAGLNRMGLQRMLMSWMQHEVEQGLRQWMQPASEVQTVEAQARPEDHGQSEGGRPGETPLARKVIDELAGYGGTEA
ncbi:MAG: hypothetical protein U0931_10150 [Vulcanimicrobiota bacterium]